MILATDDLRMSWSITCLVLLVIYLSPGLVTIASGQVQMKVLGRDSERQCPTVEERERARSEIYKTTDSIIAFLNTCDGTPGWRRVVFINMTNTSYNCPAGLNLTSYSKRTCGRSHTTRGGCSSTTFSVGSSPYSHVCGRIRGYQFGATSAFYPYTEGLDSYYVQGVSLTHGDAGRRQHIWTFAAGLTEESTSFPYENCPCDTSRYDRVPAFVGNGYFCESGLHSAWSYQYVFYLNDVLWDGQDCMSTSACCHFNNPPWFTKQLPAATTDDIELRLCTDFTPAYDDVPIELIELYVQ